MREATTIYGICHGSYSDWTVNLLCETRKQAEDAIAEMGGGYDIEEFDYFPAGSGPGVHRVYQVRGLEGSMAVNVESWKQFGPAPARPQVSQEPYGFQAHPVLVQAYCRDRTAAIKAVKDRLAALKAEGDWMPLGAENARLVGLGESQDYS